MKKTMHYIAMILCVVMVVGCLTGCSKKPTAESLLAGYREKVDATNVVAFDTNMVVEMQTESLGTKEELTVNAEMKNQRDDVITMLTGTVHTTRDDIDETTDLERYLVEQGNDNYAQFTKYGNGWAMDETTFDSHALLGLLDNIDLKDFKLTIENNIYVVRGGISIQDALNVGMPLYIDSAAEIMSINDVPEDVLKDVEFAVIEYRFDMDTGDIISVTIDMAEAMESVMKWRLKDNVEYVVENIPEPPNGGEKPFSGEDIDTLYGATVMKAEIAISNITFDDVGEMDLPNMIAQMRDAALDRKANTVDEPDVSMQPEESEQPEEDVVEEVVESPEIVEETTEKAD